MFNDRDLAILGGGGLLAVLFLLPPWPFGVKAALALIVLVSAMSFALLRVGRDRETIERYLYRRLRFMLATRRYSYHGRAAAPATAMSAVNRPAPDTSLRPVELAWDELNVYVLMTVWLAVIGIYFVVWLNNGGAEQLANWLRG